MKNTQEVKEEIRKIKQEREAKETDFMVKDVFKFMTKFIICQFIFIAISLIIFVTYAIHVNHQYEKLVTSSNQQFTDFFNEFEIIEETILDVTDGGTANYIGNDGDINNGYDYQEKNNKVEG